MKKTTRIDIAGQKWGRLTAVSFDHIDKHRSACWVFLCECGTKKIIKAAQVKYGYTKSCGCLQKENTQLQKEGKLITHFVHGFAADEHKKRDRFYGIWQGMKTRCLNCKMSYYYLYGGRGITVCEEWLEFLNFKKDMLASYNAHVGKYGEKNTTIDRIDNDGDYTPENCRWATYSEQNSNKRPRGSVVAFAT